MRDRIMSEGMKALPRSWNRPWIIARILATPPWMDMREIRAVYERARELSESTGEPWVVDHIVPLNHPMVCGLHVSWNLRPVRETVNAAKSNRWNPGQADLFAARPVAGQLPLFED
jgi:hypothetical protein